MTITEHFMLEQLELADNTIEHCLSDPTTQWFSMLVDDVLPNVERIWVRMEGGHLAVVHRILPVPKGTTPLLHRHRRPTGFLLKDGAYWEGRGIGTPDGLPPSVVERHLCLPGERRVMIRPDAWHWVCPVRHSVMSVNVFGHGHPGVPERTTFQELSALPPDRFARLVRDARMIYGMID